MKAPLFFPLDASKCAVGNVLLCQTVFGHTNRKLPAQIRNHSDALDGLATRPQPELLQAVSCQISPTDSNRVS
jgi:hypothetical protein